MADTIGDQQKLLAMFADVVHAIDDLHRRFEKTGQSRQQGVGTSTPQEAALWLMTAHLAFTRGTQRHAKN